MQSESRKVKKGVAKRVKFSKGTGIAIAHIQLDMSAGSQSCAMPVIHLHITNLAN